MYTYINIFILTGSEDMTEYNILSDECGRHVSIYAKQMYITQFCLHTTFSMANGILETYRNLRS